MRSIFSMNGNFDITLSQNLSYCEKCSHYPVCSKKETYATAQKAVEQLSVTLPDERDEAAVTTRLSNIGWIKPLVLECKHHILKPEFTVGVRSVKV